MTPLNPTKRLGSKPVFFWMVLALCIFWGNPVLSQMGFSGSEQQGRQAITEQAVFIQSQIEAVQQNLEWLELKIKHLEDFNRFVPPKLYNSATFKKEKIVSLKALKKRVDSMTSSNTMARPKSGIKGQNSFEKEVGQKIKQAGLNDWVALVRYGDKLVMENRLPILFSSASAQVSKGYDPFIKKWVRLLKGYDVRIRVKGYADSDPINTDKYPSNLELGAARAGAVVQRFLFHGIKPGVFKISSTGEHRFEAAKPREWKNLQRHANVMVEFKTM